MALEKVMLFTVLQEFQLHHYDARGTAHRKTVKGLSYLAWPNGRPCHEANMYLLALLGRPGRSGAGLTTSGEKGGTIGQYASKISQLLHYCFRNSIELHRLVDGDFHEFITAIRKETVDNGDRKKNENTISDVGRSCLDFLEFVGRLYGMESFVAKHGVIKGYKERFVSSRGGKDVVTFYWHHSSFSRGERLNTRNPISRKNVKDLRTAIDEIGSGDFVAMRRHIMIALLVNLGGRRGEIGTLTVASVRRALKMADPMLEILTLKIGGGTRLIPVSRGLLQQLDHYIEFWRNPLVKSKRNGEDHGLLFVSATTGREIQPQSITNEIGILRKFAGIEEQACAHMFRHAFITNLFVLLIQRHNIESIDEFSKLLIDGGKLKAEVLEWTGGKTAGSLDTYINLAFEEVSGFASTVKSVTVMRYTRLFLDEAECLVEKLVKTKDIDSYAKEFLASIKALREDFTVHDGEDAPL